MVSPLLAFPKGKKWKEISSVSLLETEEDIFVVSSLEEIVPDSDEVKLSDSELEADEELVTNEKDKSQEVSPHSVDNKNKLSNVFLFIVFSQN